MHSFEDIFGDFADAEKRNHIRLSQYFFKFQTKH